MFQQPRHFLRCALPQRQPSRLDPAPAVAAINDRARKRNLLPQMAARMVGNQKGLLAPQLPEKGKRREILARFDTFEQAVDHAANLVINHQLFQAQAALEVQHSRPRNAVDPCEAGHQRAHARF